MASDFGKNILELRKKNNLTQKQFGEKIGTTSTTVSAWETRDIKPVLDVAINIAKVFNVSLDWLCGTGHGAKIETYGDLFNTLNDVLIESYPMSYIEAYDSPEHEPAGGILRFNNRIEIGMIFGDWSQVYSLYRGNVINTTMYNAWIKDRCQLLSKYPLDVSENSVELDNLMSDWEAGENRTEARREEKKMFYRVEAIRNEQESE